MKTKCEHYNKCKIKGIIYPYCYNNECLDKPHKPKVEGSPRLEEASEGRTSIPPTNELAGILEVFL